jgi:phage tail sheath gpL-like
VLVQANGINQKSPMVFLCSPAALTTAGAVVTAPAPDLTASERFWLDWCKETPQQAYEIAARTAAIYVEDDYPAANLAGKPLKTRGGVPLRNPALADVPSDADMNSAIRSYYMTPVSANSRDELVIVRPTTTSNASNQDMHEPSIIRQVDRFRVDLRQRLTDLFITPGKVLRTSTPKTPRAVTTGSVKDAIYAFCREKDDQDLFDDAEAFKDAIVVEISATLGRLDVFVPEAVIRPLYQFGVSLGPQ